MKTIRGNNTIALLIVLISIALNNEKDSIIVLYTHVELIPSLNVLYNELTRRNIPYKHIYNGISYNNKNIFFVYLSMSSWGIETGNEIGSLLIHMGDKVHPKILHKIIQNKTCDVFITSRSELKMSVI